MTVKPTPRVGQGGKPIDHASDPRAGHRPFSHPTLHPTDEHGTYKARDVPGRNDLCPCGSGQKAKRCHPFGLRARVNTIDAAGKGPCTVCKRDDVETIPLNHDAVQGTLGRICKDCLRADPTKALEALMAATKKPAAPAPPPRPALRPVVNAVLVKVPDVCKESPKESWSSYPDHGTDNGHPTTYVKCDRGHIGNLAGHRILDDGTVQPSIGCNYNGDADGCGWHVWARLADWSPLVPPAPPSVPPIAASASDAPDMEVP